jgi:hypothetical protein
MKSTTPRTGYLQFSLRVAPIRLAFAKSGLIHLQVVDSPPVARAPGGAQGCNGVVYDGREPDRAT